MLTSVSIKNFQSLYDVQIPLTQFTVLTGRSSSGKSAFIRACRLLMENQRGTAFISYGEHTSEVTATLSDHTQISIERGKTNQYVIDNVGPDSAHMDAQVYTKLGGEVPEDVQNFFGIDTSLSIAGQFDPPFLLTASGAEVARTLGALTNVDVVMAAAREANRLKLQHSSSARAAQDALAAVTEQLDALGDVEQRAARVAAAEQAYSEVANAEHQAGQAAELLQAIKESAAALKSIEVPEIPDLEELFGEARAAAKRADAAADLFHEIQTIEVPDVRDVPDLEEEIAAARLAAKMADEASWLQMEISLKMEAFSEAKEAAADAVFDVEVLEQQRAEALREMGICPLCGSDTSHMAHPAVRE